MLRSVAAIALAFVCVIQGQDHPAPHLADQFSVDIEANIIPQKLTLNLREYYDKPNQRARYEINTLTGSTWYLVDYSRGIYYTIVNSAQCSQSTFNPSLPSFAQGILPLGYSGIEGLSDTDLQYGDNYTGRADVRGVPCEGWVTHFSFNFTDPGYGPAYHDIFMTFYYSLDDWSFHTPNNTLVRKPMRAILNGTRTLLNGSSYQYLNSYEFVNFLPVSPMGTLFEVPDMCLPIHESIIRLVTSTQSGAGLAAGMFFLGMAIGAFILGMSWLGWKRHQEKVARRDRGGLAMQGE